MVEKRASRLSFDSFSKGLFQPTQHVGRIGKYCSVARGASHRNGDPKRCEEDKFHSDDFHE